MKAVEFAKMLTAALVLAEAGEARVVHQEVKLYGDQVVLQVLDRDNRLHRVEIGEPR